MIAFTTILLTAAQDIIDSGLADQVNNSQPLDWMEKIQGIIYPAIIGGYLIFSAIRKAVKKIKEQEADEKKKEDQTTKLRNEKKFKDFAHQESMQYMVNMKTQCNKYRDQASPDRAHYLQIENGTIAITGIYNMFVTSIAEDDRYSRLPRVYPHINRIPYNRLTALFAPLLEMKPYKQNVLEVNGEDEKSKRILEITNEICASKVGSCLALPIFDTESFFVGCVLFDYLEPNFNNRNLSEQKDSLKEFQVSINTLISSYNINLIRKREELGLPVIEDRRDSV